MVGNFVDAVGRDVGDNDASLGGGFHINIVESDAVACDNLTLLSSGDDWLANRIPTGKDTVHHRCKR